ncbi:MAG: RluA family pseudouridine synthase, partial [Christensenellaceae bacterium]|nr:RluA family pseudouridine synthase [Christensenellaceae bacterium]
NGEIRPGIVHRLDKDTTGLIVIAKNDAAHVSLAEQIKEKSAHRSYQVLVHGNLKEESVRVEAPIGRHRTDRKRMAIIPDGRYAATNFTVLERFKGYVLLRADLETGRTHQIRVHSAHIGHCVVGDPVYGSRVKDPFKTEGQLLHAFRLALDHPRTGERMVFTAPLPDDFEAVLEKLRKIQ